ncbi:MAG: 3-phosphoshikimate 1-carboxyvinyltransferase [Pseudomonadota bacterium]|nr:3-phosphoshikimate 1-carboxyvinyltransferase [Pseudomonadota bacterium]
MVDSHNLIVNGSKKIFGEIYIPGDKSITHRAIILASLCKGKVKIESPLFSEDCNNTIQIMQSLGVRITKDNNNLVVEGKGINGLKKPTKKLDAGNSGTLMRLITGVLAMQSFESIVTGDKSLQGRPMERIIEPLKSMGANIISNKGKAPLNIKPNKSIKSILFCSEIASAQIKSCLILAALFVNEQSVIEEITSTRDHTELLLEYFGHTIERINNKIIITGGKDLKCKQILIPSDISSAAFFIIGALIKKDSNIIIKNIGLNPHRTGILEVLTKMGADIKIINKYMIGAEPAGDIQVKHSKLEPIKLSGEIISKLIDELPILFIACATCSGVSEFSNIKELRYKESDRIKSMEAGLRKLGIEVSSTENSFKIKGGKFGGGIIDSFNDHRVAMSFIIAGLISAKPVTVTNTLNINTSFPNFYSVLREAGVEIYRI